MALRLNNNTNTGTTATPVSIPRQPEIPAAELQAVESVSIRPPPGQLAVEVTAPVVQPASRREVNPVFRESGPKKEQINHPDHYGGKDNPFEVIKVIRAWGLTFSLGNVVKYIARAGKKDPSKRIEDLHKAMWYLQEEINSEYEKQSEK